MADDDRRSPKRLLDERGLRPRKRFGQNFLVDPRFAARVASAVPEGSFAIEIGGGTGALTEALAARARKTIVLEIDRDLAALLVERFAGDGTVDVRSADALEFDFSGELRVQSPPRAICANLPYYITTPLLERIVEAAAHWETAILMVQREYAHRLTASPGGADYGSLTVFVGYHCNVEKLFDVGAAGFYPAPSVASSVVRLTPVTDRAKNGVDESLLLRVVRAAFAQRRKTLANCLVARAAQPADRRAITAAIREAGLGPDVRGERLSLEDFRRLTTCLAAEKIAIG